MNRGSATSHEVPGPPVDAIAREGSNFSALPSVYRREGLMRDSEPLGIEVGLEQEGHAAHGGRSGVVVGVTMKSNVADQDLVKVYLNQMSHIPPISIDEE